MQDDAISQRDLLTETLERAGWTREDNLSVRTVNAGLELRGVRLRSETEQPLQASRWSDLLREPDGPFAMHRAVLAEMQGEKVDDRMIAGSDEALAAIAALQGSTSIALLLEGIDLSPVAARMVTHTLSLRALLDALVFASIAHAASSPVAIALETLGPKFDANAALDALLLHDEWSACDRATLALLAIDLGRADMARLLVKAERSPPMALVATVLAGRRDELRAAWSALLVAFPAELAARRLAWSYLVVAASVVLPMLDGVSPTDIVDALHAELRRAG